MQLKDYVGHGGLVVNWRVFGSGGLKVRCAWAACCTACSLSAAAMPAESPQLLHLHPPLAAPPKGQPAHVLLALQRGKPPRCGASMHVLPRAATLSWSQQLMLAWLLNLPMAAR